MTKKIQILSGVVTSGHVGILCYCTNSFLCLLFSVFLLLFFIVSFAFGGVADTDSTGGGTVYATLEVIIITF